MMEGRLTDETLTQEQGIEVARKAGKAAPDQGSQFAATADETMHRAGTVGRTVSDQVRAAAADAGTMAQDLARRARHQAAAASDALYQQGTRASDYLTQNINEYPLAALLIAGAIGYGLAYLVYTQWQRHG
jgi:ElaB/YqjD/DUF883 family membrane-anchored ribosome-binding protein